MGLAAVTILGMRSEFDRYHLPIGLLGVIALVTALDWLHRSGARRFHGALIESRS
jgi:hypothetical protein